MKIHELTLRASKASKRVGRGIAAGGGKTAGRGTKGQGARGSGKIKPGFEGGQTKLARRLPKKRGFKAFKQTRYQIIKVAAVATLKNARLDPAILHSLGLISKLDQPVKLLGDGEISRALTIKVQAASKSAIAKIKKAKGSVIIEPLPRERQKKSLARPASQDKA